MQYQSLIYTDRSIRLLETLKFHVRTYSYIELFFREYAGELRTIALRRNRLFKVYNAGQKGHTHASTCVSTIHLLQEEQMQIYYGWPAQVMILSTTFAYTFA